MKMEEGNESGKFLHAVKLSDYLFCLYCSSNSNKSPYYCLSCLSLLYRLINFGIREKVTERICTNI